MLCSQGVGGADADATPRAHTSITGHYDLSGRLRTFIKLRLGIFPISSGHLLLYLPPISSVDDSTMSDAQTVTIGVLCIQGAFIEHISMLQRIPASIVDKGNSFKVKVVDVRRPEQVPSLDGLILPGGESTTLSIFLKKNNFEEALKSWAFDEKRPGVVWGTCAGLILLSDQVAGQKQGGQATVSRKIFQYVVWYLALHALMVWEGVV